MEFTKIDRNTIVKNAESISDNLQDAHNLVGSKNSAQWQETMALYCQSYPQQAQIFYENNQNLKDPKEVHSFLILVFDMRRYIHPTHLSEMQTAIGDNKSFSAYIDISLLEPYHEVLRNFFDTMECQVDLTDKVLLEFIFIAIELSKPDSRRKDINLIIKEFITYKINRLGLVYPRVKKQYTYEEFQIFDAAFLIGFAVFLTNIKKLKNYQDIAVLATKACNKYAVDPSILKLKKVSDALMEA